MFITPKRIQWTDMTPITKKRFVDRYLNNSRGFSIIELILALALTSIVICSVFMACLLGMRVWNSAENRLEVQQNIRIAMNTLSTEIRKADSFEIESGNRGIRLTYENGLVKAYRFHPASGEIRMYQSGTTVARHIKDCKFFYEKELIAVKITNKPITGVEERDYTFCLHIKGNVNDDK